MDDDDRFSAALHRAVRTLEPPTGHLVDGAITRGRRRQRLVRGVEAFTAAAVLTGVGALVITLLPSGGGGPGTQDAAAGSTPIAKATSVSSRAHPAPAPVATTPQVLLQTALDTLPQKGTTSHYAGNYSVGYAGTQFVYDDGRGAAQIYLDIGYAPYRDENSTPCVIGRAGCTVLADGAHALVTTSREYGAGDPRTPHTTQWSIALVRADGLQVGITEFNAPQEKGAELTRTDPPFSVHQLTTWADGSQWRKNVTAARAATARHLFLPDNLDGKPSNPSSNPTGTAQPNAKNCKIAKELKKSVPAYCTSAPR